MSATITHPFVSTKSDGEDTSLVRPSNWNASHTVSGYETGQILFGNMSQDANLFWDNTNKRLGIGTTNPKYPLTLTSNSAIGWDYASNADSREWTLSTDNNVFGDFVIATTTAKDGSFLQRLIILPSGKVGIGDQAPGELLDVAGNIDLTGVLKIDDVQVISNRVVDADLGNTIESAFTALYPDASALLDSIRTLITTHGLGAAS